MRKVLVGFFIVMACARSARAGEWERLFAGRQGFTCVAAAPGGAVCAGTDSGEVAVSNDGGLTWDTAQCADGNSRINALGFDAAGSVYAATGTGIYSLSPGRGWRLEFRPPGSECFSIAAAPDGVYAAGGTGIFASRDRRSWRREPGVPPSRALVFCARRSTLFALTSAGVYRKLIPGGQWEKARAIIILSEDDGSFGETGELSARPSGALAADDDGVVFAASGGRFLKSMDRGDTWKPFRGTGAGIAGGSSAVWGEGEIALAASLSGGVYRYTGAGWEDFSGGLSGARIAGFAGSAERVYCAGDGGLFRVDKRRLGGEKEAVTGTRLSRYLDGQPDIRALQRAAVEYADATAEKITAWRRKAAKKALLPHVNIGVSREVGDLWHWESGSTTKVEDDCLRKGKAAVGWSAGLTWELGDLVWSSDQTGIDARSRLNTELRGQIIDEVTRLYFERVKLAMELEDLALEDGKKRAEKGLRIAELTASLDGLTDGYFSLSLGAESRARAQKDLAKEGHF